MTATHYVITLLIIFVALIIVIHIFYRTKIDILKNRLRILNNTVAELVFINNNKLQSTRITNCQFITRDNEQTFGTTHILRLLTKLHLNHYAIIAIEKLSKTERDRLGITLDESVLEINNIEDIKY